MDLVKIFLFFVFGILIVFLTLQGLFSLSEETDKYHQFLQKECVQYCDSSLKEIPVKCLRNNGGFAPSYYGYCKYGG